MPGYESDIQEVGFAAMTPSEELRNPELEARILAALDDATGYLVYADWLSERGDPRGELITVQHAIDKARNRVGQELYARQKALLETHRERFLGPMAGLPRGSVSWELGFINALSSTELDHLPEMLAHPSMRFLRSYSGPAEAAVLLSAAGVRTLGRLTLTGNLGVLPPLPNLESLTITLGIYRALPLLPKLRQLFVTMGNEQFRSIVQPALARLALTLPPGSRLPDPTEWALPELAALDLSTGWPQAGDPPLRAGALEKLLAWIPGRPLKELVLRGFLLPRQQWERLAESKALAQLDTLRLSGTGMDLQAAEALRVRAEAFAHLECLDLRSPTPLPEQAMRRLKSVAGKHWLF